MVVLRLDRKSGTVEVVRVVESPKDQPITAISGLIAKFIQEEIRCFKKHKNQLQG